MENFGEGGKIFSVGKEESEKKMIDTESGKEQGRERIVLLARELSESGEKFPFSGINPHSYENLKKDEEEFPGFATPIDELIERLKQEGMKVVFGTDPESGNVFVVPYGSDDIEMDSVFPKHLQEADGMDGKLRELILLNRN